MGILFTIVWNAISKLTVSRLRGAAVVHPALSTPTKGNASWRMATGSPSGHGTWHKCICRALTNHFSHPRHRELFGSFFDSSNGFPSRLGFSLYVVFLYYYIFVYEDYGFRWFYWFKKWEMCAIKLTQCFVYVRCLNGHLSLINNNRQQMLQ